MCEKSIKWFVFLGGKLLVLNNSGNHEVPMLVEPPVSPADGCAIHSVGEMEGVECRAFKCGDSTLDEVQLPGDDYRFEDLRASYNYLSWDDYYMAGRASQILFWDNSSRFCSTCGSKTEQIAPIAKRCVKCGREYYPRISPASIVLVKREGSILLVHARSYRGTQKGLVAGFLEVGETLEACVCREVMEETGLTITNLRYFGNQPWPYPSGLMIGFVADYLDGDIKLQDEELTSGAFYTRDNLPELPPKLSIARQMIDAWLEGKL